MGLQCHVFLLVPVSLTSVAGSVAAHAWRVRTSSTVAPARRRLDNSSSCPAVPCSRSHIRTSALPTASASLWWPSRDGCTPSHAKSAQCSATGSGARSEHAKRSRFTRAATSPNTSSGVPRRPSVRCAAVVTAGSSWFVQRALSPHAQPSQSKSTGGGKTMMIRGSRPCLPRARTRATNRAKARAKGHAESRGGS